MGCFSALSLKGRATPSVLDLCSTSALGGTYPCTRGRRRTWSFQFRLVPSVLSSAALYLRPLSVLDAGRFRNPRQAGQVTLGGACRLGTFNLGDAPPTRMSVNTFAFVSVPPQETSSYIRIRIGFQPLQLRSARLCGPVSEWPRITSPIGAAGSYVQSKQRRARLPELQFHWIQPC